MSVAYHRRRNESVMFASLRIAYDSLGVAVVAGQRALQTARREIRPQTIDIMQPRIGDLPEHELAVATTAAGTNQQVDGPRPGAPSGRSHAVAGRSFSGAHGW